MEQAVLNNHQNPSSAVFEGSIFAVLREAGDLLLQWIDLVVEPSDVTTWGNGQQLMEDFECVAFPISPSYLCQAMEMRGYEAVEIEDGQLAFYCQPCRDHHDSEAADPIRYHLNHLPLQ